MRPLVGDRGLEALDLVTHGGERCAAGNPDARGIGLTHLPNRRAPAILSRSFHQPEPTLDYANLGHSGLTARPRGPGRRRCRRPTRAAPGSRPGRRTLARARSGPRLVEVEPASRVEHGGEVARDRGRRGFAMKLARQAVFRAIRRVNPCSFGTGGYGRAHPFGNQP